MRSYVSASSELNLSLKNRPKLFFQQANGINKQQETQARPSNGCPSESNINYKKQKELL